VTVTIMYRNSYDGGDGWTYYPLTVAIADTCPVCGGPRGEPVMQPFREDGEWYALSTWTNECGHLDRYQDVYAEYLTLAGLAAPVA
jgi:hypothetical protein